ncbi:uncharacterized protein LOC129789617 isoform X1 [Lutzomyia longipalpis]|nr:uncharacterized protein LOC129789617 isoform X1 [Lutzomyia longipalpis]
MTTDRKLNILLVFTVILIGPTSGFIEDAIDVARLLKEVFASVAEGWHLVEQTELSDQIDLPFIKHKHEKIMSKMNELSQQIQNVEFETINTATWTIQSINRFIHNNFQLEWSLHELKDLMNMITLEDQNMRQYAQHVDKLETTTLLRYTESIVSPNSNSVQGWLDRINLLVMGSNDLKAIGKSGLFQMMGHYMKEVKDQVCSSQKAAQQVIYQMYSAISLTELKGYAMMQFSWMLLKTFGKGNYTQEAQLMRQRFENRTERTQELVKRVMERSELSVWRCDPDVHVEGETYEQFTRLLQGYIENEVDMNTDGTCKENCAAYTFTESHGCFKDLYCAQQPQCKGKIINCTYVDSDMWICPSKLHTNRRYEYIRYENGRVLGEESTCVRGTTKVDSWWRWLFWHCSYCFCLCDEQGYKSDRYFNLRETVSDIDRNKVIVGVRFRKVNRIMHLQIQQGELLPRGVINASTVEWKAVNDYRLLDSGLKNGVDYHTMEWNKRAIDLDDLQANPGHVVTGVKFRSIGPRVNLEIRVQEFNFETGKLDNVGVWISNDNTEVGTNQRTRIYLRNPDVPTKGKARSQVDSKTNQFIEFTHTDMDADAAQTTVPFLDAQDVVSVPPVPLSGIGIYHKGLPLSGGFVAPKLIVYNMAQHVYTPKPGQEDLWDTYG